MLKNYQNIVFYSLVLILSITGCKEDMVEPTDCILSSIYYNENNWLSFTSISGGQLYQLKQYVRVDGENKLFASYQYEYKKIPSLSKINWVQPDIDIHILQLSL